jgi:hypothetical protein
MDDTATRSAKAPLLLWLSVAASASILPLLWLLERFSGSCADGLCNFFPGLLIVGGGLLAAIVLAVAGLRRGERPRWIALLSLPVLGALAWLTGAF